MARRASRRLSRSQFERLRQRQKDARWWSRRVDATRRKRERARRAALMRSKKLEFFPRVTRPPLGKEVRTRQALAVKRTRYVPEPGRPLLGRPGLLGARIRCMKSKMRRSEILRALASQAKLGGGAALKSWRRRMEAKRPPVKSRC